MISSLCNTISLNYLACQPRVARSPIHVRTAFKEVGRQPSSSPRFFFPLRASRFKTLHVLFMSKFSHAKHTHIHACRLITVSYFKEGISIFIRFNISFLFYFDTIFSLFFFCFHQSNKGMEGNFSSDLSIKEFFSSSVHFNEKDKSFIIK